MIKNYKALSGSRYIALTKNRGVSCLCIKIESLILLAIKILARDSRKQNVKAKLWSYAEGSKGRGVRPN